MPSGAAVAEIAPEGVKKSSFRPDIQGLRAVAVIAVILDHLLGWPRGGFVGVDMFFVVSGYLITGLLLREEQKTGTISFTGFYGRRAKRILPAALLVTVVTVVASWFLTPGPRFVATAWDAVWSTLFVANWNFAIQGTDYFQQDLLPSPLQHFWSLSVEEQFYFVWPWLMLGVYALAARRLRWRRQTTIFALAAIMGAIVVGSFLFALYLTASDTNFAYFSSLSRAWELGVGAMAAILGPLLRVQSVTIRTVAIWIGIAGLVASVFLVDEASGFPAPAAALPVAATVLVLLAGEHGGWRYAWPLTNPVSRYIGDISYSLYLWHFPIIILLLAVIPGGTPLYFGTAVILIAVLSITSYHFVEDPLRRTNWLPSSRSRRRRRRRSSARGVIVRNTVVLVATSALVVVLGTMLAIRENDDRARVEALIRSESTGAQPSSSPTVDLRQACEGAAVMVDPTCTTVNFGSVIAPAAADAATDYGAYSDKCWTPADKELKTCQFGVRSAPTLRVAIAGDSHASQLVPGLVDQLDGLGWSLDTFVGDGCLVTVELFDTCADVQPEVLEALSGGDYDVILVTSSRNKRVDVGQYADTLGRLSDTGAKVIAIGDNPTVSQDALLCFQRIGFDPSQGECGTSQSETPSDPLVDAASLAGISVVDLTDLYCSNGWCPATMGGVIVYRDAGSHITATFSKTLAPYLAQRVTAATTS